MITAFKTLNLPMRLLALALVAATSFIIMRVVITLTNPESLWTKSAVNAPSSTRPKATSKNFSFTSDPFNIENEGGSVEEDIIDLDVPETTLNLKMTGRVVGDEGSAILRTADNKENVYKAGEEVISDVILKVVKKDYVVLSVNGQLQRLTFEYSESNGLAKKAPEFAENPSSSKASRDSLSTALSGGAGSNDIASIFQNVKLGRAVKNGKLQGFTVKSNRPDVDIKRFGFEPGDIITSVDGKDLSKGKLDFLELFQESAQRGGVEITVIRNGQTQKIQLGAN